MTHSFSPLFTTLALAALCAVRLPAAAACELPDAVQEILLGCKTQVAAIEQRSAQQIAELTERTTAQLRELRAEYERAKNAAGIAAIDRAIEQLSGCMEVAAPASPSEWRGRAGDSYVIELTGRTGGSIWGSGTYTDDSDLATAAVHAGLLRNGETGLVRVTIVAALSSYMGSSRNGVTTSSYGPWGGAYTLSRPAEIAAGGIEVTTLGPGELLRLAVGDVKYCRVTGSTGSLWGTDFYTTDSSLSAAAVHAGVLALGETGVVKVTIREGRPGYEGSERNGVRSSSWGSYTRSFQVERP